MVASTYHTTTYESNLLSQLAKLELEHLLNIPVSPRFHEVFQRVRNYPARVELNFPTIRTHLRPYLERHQTSYESYDALRAGLGEITRMLDRTVCQLKFTQLVDGLYAGSPRQLHALWTGNEKLIPPKRDGLGTKVAYVKFLSQISI